MMKSQPITYIDSSNTRSSSNAGLVLGQRRRRWPNIEPALDERLVFAGERPVYVYINIYLFTTVHTVGPWPEWHWPGFLYLVYSGRFAQS